MSDLGEQEIKVFTDTVTHYFSQLTREAAAVRGAYLEREGNATPSFDFTGQIVVSGLYRGSVTVSAPRAMIRHLLVALHETDHSEDNLRDTVGELANTLAGNARRHFGERMEISVPTTASGGIPVSSNGRQRPYVIMVNWKTYSASLVVDIEKMARD
jgi:chemotaxis protein CheX